MAVLRASNLAKSYKQKKVVIDVSLEIRSGEIVGLLGPNGAGKTPCFYMIVGLVPADRGRITIDSRDITPLPMHGRARQGIGYLPQEASVFRKLSVRDNIMAILETRKDLNRQAREGKLESLLREFHIHHLSDSLGMSLSGGERRRVALARILLSKPDLLLLDEPTNHLDADSITWLRGFLQNHEGGLVVISHDVDLLADVVNRVWFLDAVRGEADVYNMGWKRYLDARATDEQRRKRERANAEKKASALRTQAAKLGAKATKATAAQNMLKRADRMLDALDEERVSDRTARIRFPEPATCGKTPLMASGLTKTYGSLEIFTGVDLAIDKGSRVVILGLNGAGKTTMLRILAGVDQPDTGMVVPGHGLKVGYYAQEHETLDTSRTVLENMQSAAPQLTDTGARSVLGSFLFSGDDAHKPAKVLSGGEKTRLALASLVVSSANVLLLDEPTNNLDPASREEVLAAIRSYEGAIILVTHDEGAVHALEPDRVLLLPDGDEDLWNDGYADLVSLA